MVRFLDVTGPSALESAEPWNLLLAIKHRPQEELRSLPLLPLLAGVIRVRGKSSRSRPHS